MKPLEMRDAISARGLCGLINQLRFQDEIGCVEGWEKKFKFQFCGQFLHEVSIFCGIKNKIELFLKCVCVCGCTKNK